MGCTATDAFVASSCVRVSLVCSESCCVSESVDDRVGRSAVDQGREVTELCCDTAPVREHEDSAGRCGDYGELFGPFRNASAGGGDERDVGFAQDRERSVRVCVVKGGFEDGGAVCTEPGCVEPVSEPLDLDTQRPMVGRVV